MAGMDVAVTLKGDKRFRKRMQKAPKKVRSEAEKRLRIGGELLVGAAQKEIRGSRSRAKRTGGAVTAKAGRLGVDTGRGRQSIAVQVRKKGKFTEVVVAAFGVSYMSIHELRGKYTWLKPGLRKVSKRIKKEFGQIFKVV